MKILILNKSILLLRIKPNKDTVKATLIFFINWNCFKSHSHEFNLSELPMVGVKKFYENLSNEWNCKYRI